MSKQPEVSRIVGLVASRFNCFGGGCTSQWNPISAALAERAPMFAAGVDVEEVVRFILENAKDPA